MVDIYYIFSNIQLVVYYQCCILIGWATNIDLARAKSEVLDNIYSLFKQNIKSCDTKQRKHAMRENSEKQQ